MASFWLKEHGDLLTCSRMLWVSRKVLRSPCGLWVVALGIKGRPLFMAVLSEMWPCDSWVSLRRAGAHELHGP